MVKDHVDWFNTQIKKIQSDIDGSPELKHDGELMESIPGIGKRASSQFLSKANHTAARKALFMPSMVAKRHNPAVIAMAKRLEQRGLTPKTIVGANMRKLVHLIYGVLKSGEPVIPPKSEGAQK